VDLRGEDEELYLDTSKVYLVPRERIHEVQPNEESLAPFSISQALIDELFSE